MRIFFYCIASFHIIIYSQFKLGIENISPSYIACHPMLTGRVGLVTNQTGITQKGTPTVEVLRAAGINVVCIFAPEHGYAGTVPAGESITNAIEPKTGIPIMSLYSKERGLVGRAINQEAFKDIDCIVFDIQDSGMRHYTYISTLLRCLEAARSYNKSIVVLDRPNPLGGIMEGPLVEPDLISFISIAPIPLRYGMTIGELACYFNNYILQSPARLHVVRMSAYQRNQANQMSLFNPLSPNIKTIHACFGYSFLGLLGEIRPFDVGVGTDDSFQCILLPSRLKIPALAWYKVQQILKDHGIESVRYHIYSERKKENLEGLKLTISTITAVSSFRLFIQLVCLFNKYIDSLSYAPTFDKAVGTYSVKKVFENTSLLPEMYKACIRNIYTFYQKASVCFLYKPFPIIKK